MPEKPVQNQPKKSIALYITFLVILFLIYFSLIIAFPFIAGFLQGVIISHYISVIILSLIAGILFDVLVKNSVQHFRTQFKISIIMSSILGLVMAIVTLITTVLTRLSTQLSLLQEPSEQTQLVGMFADKYANPHILFILAFLSFNIVILIYLIKQKEYKKLLWFLLPIAIYIILSLIFLAISSRFMRVGLA
jgi:hypothetical protein